MSRIRPSVFISNYRFINSNYGDAMVGELVEVDQCIADVTLWTVSVYIGVGGITLPSVIA